jgi:hypothetical protein
MGRGRLGPCRLAEESIVGRSPWRSQSSPYYKMPTVGSKDSASSRPHLPEPSFGAVWERDRSPGRPSRAVARGSTRWRVRDGASGGLPRGPRSASVATGAGDLPGRVSDRATGAMSIPGLPGRLSGMILARAPGPAAGELPRAEGPRVRALRVGLRGIDEETSAPWGSPAGSMQQGRAGAKTRRALPRSKVRRRGNTCS